MNHDSTTRFASPNGRQSAQQTGQPLPSCGPQRPNLDEQTVSSILNQYYDLHLVTLKKLPGYDDFSAMVSYSCSHYEDAPVRKGVIKVLGADNSNKPEFQHFIGGLLDRLCEVGLPFSAPIRRSDGTFTPPKVNLMHTDGGDCQGHYVHLLSYIEGVPLSTLDFQYDDSFIQHIGEITARMHGCAVSYPVQMPARVASPWYLVDAHLILDRIQEVNLSSGDADLSRRAITEFTDCLNQHKFKTSILHGDLKADNMVMKEDNSRPPTLAGIIDFADMVEGPVVIDIAVFAFAVWAVTLPPSRSLLHIVTQAIKGYNNSSNSALRLCEPDLELLYHCLPARCVQHLVLCRYDALYDPDNIAYLLSEDRQLLSALREFYRLYSNKQEFISSLSNVFG